MKMPVELSLREIQKSSLIILKKVDEICRELELDYFVMYGTLIGAVRHNGFIPWDDDIDIMMPRKDYNIFIRYLKENKDTILPFEVFSYKYDEKYPYMISRVSDSRYWIDVENEVDYGIGTFVDVFPLDEFSNSYLIACLKGRYYGWLSSLCFLSTRKCFPKEKRTVKSAIKFLGYILAKVIGTKALKKLIIVSDKDFEPKGNFYLGSRQWMTNNYKGNIFSLDTLEGREEMKFEDMMVRAPSNYKDILTGFYGDFMKLPKKSERIPHHLYKAFRK